jgi:hypothetical protein
LSGRLEIFPFQMNSVMPLSSEALSTVILLAGGCVAVTTFYAVATAWLCTVLPWLGRDLMGRGGWWAGLVFALMFGSLCAVAPMPSKNDNLAALHMLGLGILVWEVHLRLRARRGQDILDGRRLVGFGAVAGFVAAASVTSKLTSAPFVLPLAVCAVLLVARHRGRVAWTVLGVAVLAGFWAVLPFAVRNVPLGVSPLHPFGAAWFPGTPLLEPALRISATHEVYPLSLVGLRAMLADLPEKVHLTLASRDILLPILVVSLLLGLLDWRRPPLVVALVSILGALAAFAWMKGFNNIGRYLVTAYPLALPVVAWMGRELARRGAPRMVVLVTVLMVAIGAHAYVSKQWAWATAGTIRWSFRPELTEAQVREVARFREKGSYYLLLTDARAHIPEEARVMLVDIVYPFYLQRRAIWADEASQPLIPDWFRGRPESEWSAALKEAGVTHVLARWPAVDRALNERLIRAAGLVEVAANRGESRDTGWVLYAVR